MTSPHDEQRPARRPPRPSAPKRSLVMRILSSAKITPFLGLLALLSILYYKQAFISSSPKETKKSVTAAFEEPPLLDPSQIVGRPRPAGPLLTTSFFQAGDLLLRVHQGQLQLAIVAAAPPFPLRILRPSRPPQPLLPWLQKAGGRFALYRLGKLPPQERLAFLDTLTKTPPTSAPSSRPTPGDAFFLARLFQRYPRLQTSLCPAAALSSNEGTTACLQGIAKKSHYSDLLNL